MAAPVSGQPQEQVVAAEAVVGLVLSVLTRLLVPAATVALARPAALPGQA
jgi:hypothetical protein